MCYRRHHFRHVYYAYCQRHVTLSPPRCQRQNIVAVFSAADAAATSLLLGAADYHYISQRASMSRAAASHCCQRHMPALLRLHAAAVYEHCCRQPLRHYAYYATTAIRQPYFWLYALRCRQLPYCRAAMLPASREGKRVMGWAGEMRLTTTPPSLPSRRAREPRRFSTHAHATVTPLRFTPRYAKE